MNDNYEWCVMRSGFTDGPHRGPMTEHEAREWVREFLEDGGRPGAFYVARRSVSEWVAA